MKKTTTFAAAMLALATPAFAFTYSYDIAPGFSGGGFYLDDVAGTTLGQVNTPFANGDLNDGLFAPNSAPTDNTLIVAWDPTPLAATITIDLETLSDVTALDVHTFAFSSFNLGAPTGVTISYSADNVTYGATSLFAFTDLGNGSQSHAADITTSATGVQYIRLAFDGNTTAGDKWGLTELEVTSVAAVPEPSSTALLGLGGLALLLRRRK